DFCAGYFPDPIILLIIRAGDINLVVGFSSVVFVASEDICQFRGQFYIEWELRLKGFCLLGRGIGCAQAAIELFNGELEFIAEDEEGASPFVDESDIVPFHQRTMYPSNDMAMTVESAGARRVIML